MQPGEPDQTHHSEMNHTNSTRVWCMVTLMCLALLLAWDLYPIITAGARKDKALKIAAVGRSWHVVKRQLEKENFGIYEYGHVDFVPDMKTVLPYQRHSHIASHLLRQLKPAALRNCLSRYMNGTQTRLSIDDQTGIILIAH